MSGQVFSSYFRAFGIRRQRRCRRFNTRRQQNTVLPAGEVLESRTLLTAFASEHVSGTAAGIVASPTISNDGNRIAFISDADLTGQNSELRPEIFLVNTLDQSYFQVTDAPSVTQEVVVSGNGNRIAFVAAADLTGENADGNFEVFIYDIPSHRFYQATNTFDPALRDQPDKTNLWLNDAGTQLRYLTRVNANDTVEHEIRKVTNLTDSPVNTMLIDLGGATLGISIPVAHSRDGSQIAVSSSSDLSFGENIDGNFEIFLYEVTASTASVRQITHTTGASNLLPSLNGDGTRVMFSSDHRFVEADQPEGFLFGYLYDVNDNSFTFFLEGFRGSTSVLDSAGDTIIISNQLGFVFAYDSSSGETSSVGGGEGLPLPGAVPVDAPGIPAVIPIDPSLYSVAISANGRFGVFSGFVEDEAQIRTRGLFTLVEQLPPQVSIDFVSTNEDTDVEFNVLENDVDPNGGSLSVLTIGGEELHGRVTFNNNGKLIYRPDENYFGLDAFTYVAENSAGLKTRGSVLIEVLPVNDAPVAVADTYQLNEDHVAFHLGNVLDNDSDVEADKLKAKLISAPSHGILTLDDNGEWIYSPDKDFNGVDSFVYSASDGNDDSAETTVTLHVAAHNDAPELEIPESITAFEDVAVWVGEMSLFDIDAAEGNGLLELTIHVSFGVLYVDDSVIGGLEPQSIQGNATRSVTMIGTQEQINTTLGADGGLIYQGNLNFSGNDTMVVAASDQGNHGIGGPLSSLASSSIDVISSVEQTRLLDDHVVALAMKYEFNTGLTTSLATMVDGALIQFERGGLSVSIQRLRALAHVVQSLELSQRISLDDKDGLLKSIGTLIVGIGSSDDQKALDALLIVAKDDVFADVATLQNALSGLGVNA